MVKKEIKVLMVEPGKHPRVTTLGNDLDSLQKTVSIGNGDCLLCNEEGKLIGLEGNRRLGEDIIAGVFYIMSEDEDGNLASLSEQKIRHYMKRFWELETYDRAEIEASILFCFETIPKFV